MHPPKQHRRLSITTPGDSFLSKSEWINGKTCTGLSLGELQKQKISSFSTKEREEPIKSKKVKKSRQAGSKKPKKKTPPSTPWEFGKPKTVSIESNAETNKAAIAIQRLARGGWQRIKFRLVWLQHLLDTAGTRTETSLRHIEERLEQRKVAYRTKMESKVKAFTEHKSETAKEGQVLIKYLQKENKKMREKNAKIARAIKELKRENERLESATIDHGENESLVKARLKEIEETNKKLQVMIPMYEDAIKNTSESLEAYGHACQAERNIKVFYVKFVGNSAQHIEQKSQQPKLVDEVIGHCLMLEGDETPVEPFDFEKSIIDELMDNYESDGSEDSENYDDYTVATLDQN